MKGYGAVKNAGVLNLRVHHRLIESREAKYLGDQRLHGFIPNCCILALVLWPGAIPGTCACAILTNVGLAAVVGTAAATFDEACEFVVRGLVWVGILPLVALAPKASALRCPPVRLGSGFPCSCDLASIVKLEAQRVLGNYKYFFDLLAKAASSNSSRPITSEATFWSVFSGIFLEPQAPAPFWLFVWQVQM